jgi:hypothetical protein
LESAKRLTPILQAVLDAAGWREREKHLTAAYQVVARKFNRLSVCDALPEDATEFHGRGFMVIHGERFADAIRKQIRDPELRRIASLTSIGSVEQFSSSTDVLSDSNICRKLRTVYS